VQREHADLVVFPAVADHLAATGKEHEIRGAVPLFDHVQTFVDLSAQRFRMQIPTEENRLDGLAQFGEGLVVGRFGNPDECAGTAVFLASRTSDFVTGATICVDGGFSIR
jgi:NAD(P)-dependent dehydrogenase (short-subunit alcohol dehydrogenase family)